MLDLRPLRSASFRHLAAAGWVNEFGNWVGEIALAILVFNRTGSPLATAGLFLAMRFAPALLAPLLAVRVETLQPRFVLSTLYAAEAALLSCIVVVARHFSLPLLLILTACDGVLAIASTALSRSTLATGLDELGLLREGNALLNFGGMIVVAGGPAVSGVLVASRGPAMALEIDVATFVLAALILLLARDLRIASDRDARYRDRLNAALTMLRTRPAVSRLLVAVSLVIALGSVALPVEVVFAKHTLHAGDSGYGLLLTTWGVGMILGGFAFAVVKNLRLMPILAASTCLIALGYAGLAAAPSLAVACTFSFVGGCGNSAAWVSARTALQERIPLNRQAAVMSVLEASNQVMPAIGFVVGGAIAAASSPRMAYAISALGVAAILIFFTARPIPHVTLKAVGPTLDDESTRPAAELELQESVATHRNPSLPTFTIG
jgi:MFS family permease